MQQMRFKQLPSSPRQPPDVDTATFIGRHVSRVPPSGRVTPTGFAFAVNFFVSSTIQKSDTKCIYYTGYTEGIEREREVFQVTNQFEARFDM